METSKVNAEGLIQLEQPFIKVPLEQMNRLVRTSRKLVEKEVQLLTTQVDSIVKNGNQNQDELNGTLDTTLTRLQTLKRKLTEHHVEEKALAQKLKKRLVHLNELAEVQAIDSEAYVRWNKIRIHRVIVDYLLRMGYQSSAEGLASDARIDDLVDVDLFTASRKIELSLLEKSCTPCLQWCHENKSALKKQKSTLEFQLRLQEYIELIRARQFRQAISYARKHLTPWSETHLEEIQRAMGLIAFASAASGGSVSGDDEGTGTDYEPYRQLFDARRWDTLIATFRTDFYSLNALSSQPLLHMTLQAGLAALKTPQCYQHDNKNVNCPVCDDATFGDLAKKLPYAHHVNSTIVCRVTGKIMNEDNPPMILPNGYVYSLEALKTMAERQGGSVTCPRTRTTYQLSEARKAFIS